MILQALTRNAPDPASAGGNQVLRGLEKEALASMHHETSTLSGLVLAFQQRNTYIPA